MKNRKDVFLAAFLIACLLLPAASVANNTEKLTVGYLPIPGHTKVFIAKEQGFFAREGIDAELVPFINSADGINALKAGKVDVGSFGTTAPLIHISQGADLRIIGGTMGEDASIITRADHAGFIRSVTDLKGRKVATIRLSTGDAVLRASLYNKGINWKSDLQIFELKSPPAVIEAVKSGQVDAGVVWGPFDITAEKEGLKVVIRSHDLSPGHPCCRVTVTGRELNQRREVLVKYLRAILLAERFAAENKAETISAIEKYVKLDRALIDEAYYHGHLDQSTDPNSKGVREFWKLMQKDGFVKSNQDITPFIDVTLYKEALTGLLRENPKDPYWKALQKKFVDRNA